MGTALFSGPLSTVSTSVADAHAATSGSRSSCGSPAGQEKVHATRVPPTAFGRVFETNRPSLVRVHLARDGGPWATGFVIGAEGEVVFGVRAAPPRALAIELNDRRMVQAELLGFDLGLSLAVARLIPEGGRLPPPPLRVVRRSTLEVSQWVVSMTHDAKGKAVAYAGQVTAPPRTVQRDTPVEVLLAPVDVPGTPGTPILSIEGELLGVTLDRGERHTHVAPIEVVAPFLRQVVLGRGRR